MKFELNTDQAGIYRVGLVMQLVIFVLGGRKKHIAPKGNI